MMTEMADRSRDWSAQAEQDLQAAASLAQAGHHEWACFVCQQAAEKAVKAVHLARGQESWGHRVARLLQELRDAPAELVESAGRSMLSTSRRATPTATPRGRHSSSTVRSRAARPGASRAQVVDHARSQVP